MPGCTWMRLTAAAQWRGPRAQMVIRSPFTSRCGRGRCSGSNRSSRSCSSPLIALPARVSEEIDLDGDGQPDVRVSFVVPADPHAPLRGDVTALNSKYQSLANVGGDSYSRLVVRVNNQVIVRVPLNGASGSH